MHPFGQDCALCEVEELVGSPVDTVADRQYIYHFFLELYQKDFAYGFCKLIRRLTTDGSITINNFPELCETAPARIQRFVMEDDGDYESGPWFFFAEGQQGRIDCLKKAIEACIE